MTTRPAKRARISLACISCREQKTRCDGGKPRCGCCQRKDPESQTPCVYHNQAKARESREIQKLLLQVNHLKGKLAAEEHRNNSLGKGESGTHGPSETNVPQPPHETSTTDRREPNDFSAHYVAESGRTGSGIAEQSRLVSPQNGDDNCPDLSDSILGRGRIRSERSHESVPVDFQHLDKTSDAHFASANNNTSRILPTSADQSSETEAGNLERAIHFDQDSCLRDRGLDAACDDSQGVDGGSPQGDNGPYFYDRSSNTALMQEVNEIISPVTYTDQNTNTDRSRGEPSIYSSQDDDRAEDIIHNLPSDYLSFRDHMNFFELPPRSLADHLLDSYFNRVHLLYPLLHRPTFEAAYKKLWTPADQRNDNGRGRGLVGFVDAGLGNSINSGPQTRVFYAGVNAIFALSCQFSDLPVPKAREAAKVYLERAMALVLLDTKQLDYPTLSLVQILLLLCLHLQGTSLRNRLWNIMGMASRIAQGLGLQLEGNEDGATKSTLEIEIRRRTWYSCVMMDLTISMTLGRPAMTSSGFTTPFPQAIDDEDLCSPMSSSSPDLVRPQVGISRTSFFVESIKLWELTETIVKTLYPDTATRRKINTIGPTSGKEYKDGGFDIFVKLETAWTILYSNLPQNLRWSKIEANSVITTGISIATPESIPKWLETQQNVLHTRFLYVKLLIYRPLFLRVYREKVPQKIKDPETQTSQHATSPNHSSSTFEQVPTTIQSHFATRFAIECFQTAEELLNLVHKLHRTKAANAWWYNIFYAYFIGIVIILTRFCPSITEVVGISRIEDSWVLCQDILNHMVVYGNHAKRCLVSLQALRSRLAAWESGSAKSLQNLPAVLDYANNYQSTFNVFDQASASVLIHDNTQFGGGEGRSDIPFALGNLEPADDWAGALPWDAVLDNWWIYEMAGEDFGLTPALEPTYH